MGEKEFQLIRNEIEKKIEKAKAVYAQVSDKKSKRIYTCDNYAEDEKKLAGHIYDYPEILTFQDVNGNNILMDMIGKWCFESWGFGHIANYCLTDPRFKDIRPICLTQQNNNGENVAVVALHSGDKGFFDLATKEPKAKEQVVEYLTKHKMFDALEKYTKSLQDSESSEKE